MIASSRAAAILASGAVNKPGFVPGGAWQHFDAPGAISGLLA